MLEAFAALNMLADKQLPYYVCKHCIVGEGKPTVCDCHLRMWGRHLVHYSWCYTWLLSSPVVESISLCSSFKAGMIVENLHNVALNTSCMELAIFASGLPYKLGKTIKLLRSDTLKVELDKKWLAKQYKISGTTVR